uniref:UBA domain-containing protein n=1 Tax=Chenopodium quinoa TaxID=63459 RepID=A0A803LT13_CHEQI
MNGGPSGFNNAPVTRGVIVASALFTVFFGLQGRSNKLGFSYLVFILFSLIVSFFLGSATLALLKDTSALITAGPYGLIFSSFVPFFFDIPVSTRFRLFGFHFSDKSFIYLAGLQLLLSSWKRSILPGICGIIAGSLYRMNIFYIRRAKLPDFIASLFSRVSWPSTRSPSATTGIRSVPATAPYAGRQRNYPSPVVGSVEPSDDSVAMLVSMGFDQDSARQALVQARNDVNVATNILLEAQSH